MTKRALLAMTAAGLLPLADVAALGWMFERILGWSNPVGFWVERAAAHAVWLVVWLALLAVTVTLFERRKLMRTFSSDFCRVLTLRGYTLC